MTTHVELSHLTKLTTFSRYPTQCKLSTHHKHTKKLSQLQPLELASLSPTLHSLNGLSRLQRKITHHKTSLACKISHFTKHSPLSQRSGFNSFMGLLPHHGLKASVTPVRDIPHP
ncbi:hypothetical protein TNCV_2397991 [Trichonephila clavipes]|uniref:Uncharacterized protein n=1 Tax=Trichonephila clavipes TaxID=2585209 RepID=A0A8X6VM92_TRICX|nr:hypothetical protein TNCV_2397991 [Trichonephila clavipes]